jgi:hypothetical protein
VDRRAGRQYGEAAKLPGAPQPICKTGFEAIDLKIRLIFSGAFTVLYQLLGYYSTQHHGHSTSAKPMQSVWHTHMRSGISAGD